ncbi:1-acyl-sn-glycerol-3-phosphate acyltransferase epsilon-like [Tropilaelaps mercedesae]|uniref:1-acyl-sn-glycerol-3-phosphate acyltransferase epsilon-like n=1 Tax=Tropilaelaps mercedesae TaxID=418985 RepID=A0A1V9XXT5_9ACAR|nr:1-acyl-sn-glycerol-3-phosphate acyltransferase epsilon-like [Tropilaelaps mercedesae]
MTADSDHRSSVSRLVVRILSLTWILMCCYMGMLIHGGMAWVYYLNKPILYVLGMSWWNFVDTLYEIYERVMILQGITLLRMKQTPKTVDAFVMAAAIEKTDKLSQQRHVLKQSVAWLPFIGVFLLKRGSIFVNRGNVNWKRFDDTCRRLRRENVPACMVIYPEGTIMNYAMENPVVLEQSQQIARKHHRKPFQYVLFPRHRGFYHLLTHFKGHVNAVYDFTFIYKCTRGPNGLRKPTPGLYDILRATFSTVHIHLQRIDIQDIPEDEERVKQFLIERLAIKEGILEAFYQTGALPEGGVELPSQSYRHSLQSLLILLASVIMGFSPTGIALFPYTVAIPVIIAYLIGAYHIFVESRC